MTSQTAKHHTLARIGAIFLVAFLCATVNARATVIIYADDFSETSGKLLGLAPDVRTGTYGSSATATWQAWTNFNANGSVVNSPTFSRATAALPFEPVAGNIYTLSADINVTTSNPDQSFQNGWIGLGFYEDVTSLNSHFDHGSNDGIAWFRIRGDLYTDGSRGDRFAGPKTTDGAAFDPPTALANYKLVLNTRGTNWTVDWYVNDTKVTDSYTYATNPTITYVGFGRHGNVVGVIDNFELSVIPEPAVVTLLALALPILFRRRQAAGGT